MGCACALAPSGFEFTLNRASGVIKLLILSLTLFCFGDSMVSIGDGYVAALELSEVVSGGDRAAEGWSLDVICLGRDDIFGVGWKAGGRCLGGDVWYDDMIEREEGLRWVYAE